MDIMIYQWLRLFSWGLSWWPVWALDGLARGLGVLSFSLLRIRRRMILANLGIAFPEMPMAEKVRLGAESTYHFMATAVEFVAYRHRALGRSVTLEGEGYLQAALGQKQGIYLLFGHQGNWEAMGPAISQHFAPSHVVVKQVGGQGLNRFVVDQRASQGVAVVDRTKPLSGVYNIMRVLRKNEVVLFAVDQSRPGSPLLDFFGKKAKTNTSVAQLWRRCPAPLLPSYICRLSFGRHQLVVLPPLQWEKKGDGDQNILAQTLEINQVLEQMIRACPEQYFWMHNRWK